MSLDALDKVIDERFTAITVCLERELIMPALCLIYSGIDNMAWLSMSKDKIDVNRTEFISWTNQYMLNPNAILKMVRIIDHTNPPTDHLITQINCTAEDLYSARCGILHCGTSDSRMTRNYEATQIFYVSGRQDPVEVIDRLPIENRSTCRILHVEELFEVFQNGVNIFRSEARHNDELLKNVEPRTSGLLVAKE